MTKKENYPEHSSSVNNENASRERKYLENYLRYYIQKNAKYQKTCFEGLGWCIEPDYDTRLRTMLLDHILKHFTVKELYMIFYENQIFYDISVEDTKEAKLQAIDCINVHKHFTPQEAKRLKRKVWETNPVLFGLMLEFIHQSNLFYDEAHDEIVYPDFAKYYEIA